MGEIVPDERASHSAGEKEPGSCGAFKRLPDEIVEQILRTTDPNGFASLNLLNRKWRDVSQQCHLFLHHLTQCPSYAASQATLPQANDDNLPELRRLFACEVKRNLFEAYLRPSETIIKLVSTSISSSSSPGGEGMQFSASPRGYHILAYNSSRIYVIDVRSEEYEMKRELKILRRPVSACIKDDGTLLAVLSTEMQVDLYSLETSPPRRKQSIILDNSPRTIALSPCGSVLAAAYDGGIEVSSLNPGASATDKRAVKCDAVDALSFSFDGTQILGTTTHSASPSTVVLTAPYYDPGSLLADDDVGPMWTTSILFPNTSRDCSHAVLLKDGLLEEACWTFTYDRSFETFRAVRVEDLRNGTTYFTGPMPKQAPPTKLLPSTLPAATYNGNLVATSFENKDVWIYGVPEDLDAVPETLPSNTEPGSPSSGLGRHNSSHSAISRRPSTRTQEGCTSGAVPQWQVLCDKLRNTLVAGRKIVELDGVSTVKWVAGFGNSSTRERLVLGARGVVGPKLVTEEDDMDFVDGGRVALLDFDYRVADGKKKEVIIEVGTDRAEVLEEERRDLETEVAIVRRRTVAQSRGDPASLLRAATTRTAQALAIPSPPSEEVDDDPLLPRRIGANSSSNHLPTAENQDDAEDPSVEEQDAMDAPYAHSSPRSGTTLRRAATAVAVNRRLNPRLADGQPVEYRRADGRAEHPHESDADNWVPPPPPYQKDNPTDLPAFLRGASIVPAEHVTIPRLASPARGPQSPVNKYPQYPMTGTFPQHGVQHGPGISPRPISHQRTASDSTIISRPRTTEAPRPMSTPSAYADMDNIYDVSPPDSPRIPVGRPESSATLQPATQALPGSSLVMSGAGTGHFGSSSEEVASRVSIPAVSFETDHRPNVPSLGLQIPQAQSHHLDSSDGASPQVRRLSNSQTWPVAPPDQVGAAASLMAGYPYSAPASQDMADERFSTLPPLPTSSQLAGLRERGNQSNPRRYSGRFQVQRVPVGGRDGEPGTNQQSNTPQSAASSNSWLSEPEQPLIISTPHGVAGSFDPPGRRVSGRGREETQILAPIPRHPQTHPASPHTQPMAERLETIYSTASPQATSRSLPLGGQRTPISMNGSRFLPSWMLSPPNSSGRVSAGVSRRPSRAERSAAKNIQDAKRRGWRAMSADKEKKQKKKSKNDQEAAGGAATWTDVSGRSANKDKKCTVM